MSELTHVELVWVKNRIENRIRFGRIAEQHIIDRQRRVVSFMAGSLFSLFRRTAQEFGHLVSPLHILPGAAPRGDHPARPPFGPGGGGLLGLFWCAPDA